MFSFRLLFSESLNSEGYFASKVESILCFEESDSQVHEWEIDGTAVVWGTQIILEECHISDHPLNVPKKNNKRKDENHWLIRKIKQHCK